MSVPRPKSQPFLWGIVFPQPLHPAQSRRLLALLRRALRTAGVVPLWRREGPPLTPRQKVVLRELLSGKGTKAVGRALGISVKTVETHRQNLMDRLGLYDLPGLARHALHAGLVPPGWLSGDP